MSDESDSSGSDGETDIYDFSEETDYSVGDLEPAYDTIEDNYWVDEENEKLLVADSSWDQVDDMLEEDHSGGGSSWTSRARDYILNEHDSQLKYGGLGMASGIITGGLGFGLAGGLLFTGGLGAASMGMGGKIGDYLLDKFGSGDDEADGEPENEYDGELTEYADFDVEVVDTHSYGTAMREYEQS